MCLCVHVCARVYVFIQTHNLLLQHKAWDKGGRWRPDLGDLDRPTSPVHTMTTYSGPAYEIRASVALLCEYSTKLLNAYYFLPSQLVCMSPDPLEPVGLGRS